VLCYHAPFVRMSLADQAVAWSSGHTGHRRPDGRWRTACPLTSLLLIARSTTTYLSFVFVVTSIALATSRCCLVVSIDGESCRTVACPANPSSRRLSSPLTRLRLAHPRASRDCMRRATCRLQRRRHRQHERRPALCRARHCGYSLMYEV